MNKAEYMEALRRELQALPDSEREEALKYYSDYFEDAGSEKEGDVIAKLGSPAELARKILANFSCVPQVQPQKSGDSDTADGSASSGQKKSVIKADRGNTSNTAGGARVLLLILLVVVAFPVWGPVLASVFSVLFGLFMAALLVGVVVVLAAVAVLLGGILMLILGICTMFSAPLSGILLSGTGLLLFGLGLIFVMAGAWLCGKMIPAIIRGVVKLCRMPFAKKECAA